MILMEIRRRCKDGINKADEMLGGQEKKKKLLGEVFSITNSRRKRI